MAFNRLILHIGTEKTGSSAIEVALANNVELLAKHNMKEMPDKPWWKSANNKSQLFLYRSHYWYQRFLPQSETVVLSSELFHSRLNTLPKVQYLQKALARYFSHVLITSG